MSQSLPNPQITEASNSVSPVSSPEPKTEPEVDTAGIENSQDVLIGFRLLLLFFAVLLVAFLMSLSASIQAQVCFLATTVETLVDAHGYYDTRQLQPSQLNFAP